MDDKRLSEQSRLEHYLHLWNLKEAELLTRTATSQIYLVEFQGMAAVLKVLSPCETEEQIGAVALRYFNSRGAVRLFCSDRGAHLLEYADGDDLTGMVKHGDDAQATRIIAQVLNELHARPDDIPSRGLFSMQRWFRALFVRAAADRVAGKESLFVRGAALAERLLAEPREMRVLHGDIHHGNIRLSNRGWLAFDPKGLVGERTYDCANTLCNPPISGIVHNEARLLTNAGILAEELKVDFDRLLAYTFAYACLSVSWSLQMRDEEMTAWAQGIARIVEPHVSL